MRWTLGLSLCFVLGLSSPSFADDWEKKAKSLLRASTEEDVEQGAKLCSSNDSKEAAEVLCKALAKPPKDLGVLRKQYAKSVKAGNAPHGLGNPPGRRGGGGGLPEPEDGGESLRLALLINARMSIERHAASALGRLKSKAAIDWMIKRGIKHKSWRVRSEVALALGKSKKNRARNPLVKALKDKHPAVRSMSVDGLAILGLKASINDIKELLKDKSWQVQVAAIDALVKLDGITAVGDLVGRLPQETGRILSEVDRALQKLTGQNFKADAALWKTWYEANKAALDGGTYKRPKSGKTTTVERPIKNKFFSISVDSGRVLFVIDYSKSMRRNFERPQKKEDKRVATGSKSKKKDPASVSVPGETRIAEAKEQALRTMYGFPKETQFNVVIYHYGVELLAPKMIAASPRGVKYMEDKLLNEELGLGTNVFDALDRAYDLSGTYNFDKNYKAPVDTIYFLSDGAPTSGRFANPKKILDSLKHWNRTRKIRIHTVLIRAPAEPGKGRGERRAIRFMQQLARATGGQFVDCKKGMSK
ncbi:MAG: HEAT repeat domain-containing protein [Planctomycetota bacterium]|nr:HEAT repeat domain-containing protein [Planctomycetota bacterium]